MKNLSEFLWRICITLNRVFKESESVSVVSSEFALKSHCIFTLTKYIIFLCLMETEKYLNSRIMLNLLLSYEVILMQKIVPINRWSLTVELTSPSSKIILLCKINNFDFIHVCWSQKKIKKQFFCNYLRELEEFRIGTDQEEWE